MTYPGVMTRVRRGSRGSDSDQTRGQTPMPRTCQPKWFIDARTGKRAVELPARTHLFAVFDQVNLVARPT